MHHGAVQRDHHDGDADDPAVEVVRHLHAAALEVLAAARSFLDAAEELAEDPERIRVVGEAVSDMLREGAAAGAAGWGGADPPWTAGVAEEPATGTRAEGDPDGAGRDGDAADGDAADGHAAGGDAAGGDAADGAGRDDAEPRPRAGDGERRRVRRIPLD